MAIRRRLLLLAALLSSPAFAGDAAPLWQIGKEDRATSEFALGPDRYGDYATDGFFIVGESDPSRDWPYAHPGPADPWAGNAVHTFTIAFVPASFVVK